LAALVEAELHVLVDLVDAAAADRVVRMILQQPTPGDGQEIGRVGAAGERSGHQPERLGPVAE
jgi:hypothetical protein